MVAGIIYWWNLSSFGLQGKLLYEGLLLHEKRVERFNENRTDYYTWKLLGVDRLINYLGTGGSFHKNHADEYFRSILFEVSDTDKINDEIINEINQHKYIALVTPSNWSKQGFKGLKIPIEVIPHIITKTKTRKLNENLPHPCVLILGKHSWDRKGVFLALSVLEKAWKNGYKFHTVIRTSFKDRIHLNGQSYLPFNEYMKQFHFPYTHVYGEIPEHEHYAYFENCDVLLYPTYGGAFEIPVYEGIIYGMTVVTTEEGPWTEYLKNKNDIIPIKTLGKTRIWKNDKVHVGNFIIPDPHDTYTKFIYALENYKYLKPNDADYYIDLFSPYKIAEKYLKVFDKY